MNTMTGFFQRNFFYNTLEDWLISLAIIAGVIIIARLVYPLFSKILTRFTSRTKSGLDDLLVKKLETPIISGIILIGMRYSLERLHFTTSVDTYIYRGFVFLTAITVTWLFDRVVQAIIEEYIKPTADKKSIEIDRQMLILIERGVGLLIWAIGIIVGLNNAGFDVAGLIAGLGIGGLALALAAQDTVKNIFGGIMIFLDKPFVIDDRIKIENYDGFVQSIGIRSTRIRTLEGRIVTIPNAQFSDSPIENITIEPTRRIISVIGLVYDTTPEQLENAIQILRDISDKCSLINSNETVIFFETFNAYSLDIKLVYFIRKESDIFQTQTEINKQILARFNKAGLSFAFPTRTVYNRQKDTDDPQNN